MDRIEILCLCAVAAASILSGAWKLFGVNACVRIAQSRSFSSSTNQRLSSTPRKNVRCVKNATLLPNAEYMVRWAAAVTAAAYAAKVGKVSV